MRATESPCRMESLNSLFVQFRADSPEFCRRGNVEITILVELFRIIKNAFQIPTPSVISGVFVVTVQNFGDSPEQLNGSRENPT